MIWFGERENSPGKASYFCPSIGWWQEQLGARYRSPNLPIPTLNHSSSNKYSLFETQKTGNCTRCGHWHLFSLVGEKTWAAVVLSWCDQVRKVTRVFSVPGTERGRWQWCWRIEPVHLPMNSVLRFWRSPIPQIRRTPSSNCDESAFIVGGIDCAGCLWIMFKPACRPNCN